MFAVAFAFLLPPSGLLSDEEYVAIAKSTPQGQLYFARYPATCDVHRVWTVMVTCDYIAASGALPPGKPEKFRVHIDRRSNRVLDVEASFQP